jgi:hypothetical protein
MKKKQFEVKTIWTEDGEPRGTHIVPAKSLEVAINKCRGEGWEVESAKELRPVSLTEAQRRLKVGTIADFTYIGDIRANCVPTTRRKITAQTHNGMVSRPITRPPDGEGIHLYWLRQKVREEFGYLIVSDEGGSDYVKIRIIK